MVCLRSRSTLVRECSATAPPDFPNRNRNRGDVDERTERPKTAFMDGWQVEVFYDGDCPLCMREIRMLQRLDRRRRRIRFTDIAEPAFDASDYGMKHADFMARIQGRTSSGRWIEGVEVFAALYTAVGFGAVARLSRVPGIRQALDAAYVTFAKNRLRLTGRDCEAGVCEAPQARAGARTT